MWRVSQRTYHHGDLREALGRAAFELAREGGPDAVVLREASRRVGVSHNAGYRHFAGRDELLREASVRATSALARLIERRVAQAKGTTALDLERARVRASGNAYVEFAVKEPGLFRTAFAMPRGQEPPRPGEGAGDSGLGPFELLAERLDAFSAAGGFPAERRPLAEIPAWAAVHGLATLLVDGPLRHARGRERRALIDRVLDNVERGL